MFDIHIINIPFFEWIYITWVYLPQFTWNAPPPQINWWWCSYRRALRCKSAKASVWTCAHWTAGWMAAHGWHNSSSTATFKNWMLKGPKTKTPFRSWKNIRHLPLFTMIGNHRYSNDAMVHGWAFDTSPMPNTGHLCTGAAAFIIFVTCAANGDDGWNIAARWRYQRS